MTIEKRSTLLILAACLLWALDILVRYPISLKLSFVHIVFLESFLGVIFVLPWLMKGGWRELKRFTYADWLLAIYLGGFGTTIGNFLSTASILQASPGTFSMLQIFQPFFVVYAAHVFLKEKIDNLYFYWGLWVILSAVLMYSQDLELLLSNDVTVSGGALLIGLATMLIWGLCTIAGKKLLTTSSPMSLVAVRWVFGFLFSIPFVLTSNETLSMDVLLSGDLALRFAFISGVVGIGSMYLYYRGMKELTAAKVSFLELCYPAFGIMFSALYTFEKVSFLQAIGVASFFAFVMLILARKEASGTERLAPR